MTKTDAEFSRIAKDALVRAEEAEAEVQWLKAREERILRVLEKVEALIPMLNQVQSELQTLWVSRGAGEQAVRRQALDESRFAPHFYDK